MLNICRKYTELDTNLLLMVYEESLQNTMEEEEISWFQAEEEFLAYLKEEFFRRNGAFYALWSVSGSYVSALRMEPYGDGFLMSCLETALQSRGKGFASKLLHEALQYALQTGAMPVYAHVHKRNAISLSVHRKCGFEKMEDFGKLIDGTVSHQYYTLAING